MNLIEVCNIGEMNVVSFMNLVKENPPNLIRTSLLSNEDYALVGNPINKGIIKLERIKEINNPEKGDFLTEKGTTGPIRGNVFLRINDKDSQQYYMLCDWEVYRGNGSVFDQIKNYLTNLRLLN